MKLIKVEIKNFRCLKEVNIPFRELTLLIGENDAGKTTVLDLLDLILNEHQPEESDYYFFDDGSGNPESRADEIEAVLTFQPYSDQLIPLELLSPEGFFRLKKRVTKQSGETWYDGRCFDQIVLNQDLTSLRVSDLDAIIQEIGIVVEGRLNKEEKIQRIQEYKLHAPFHVDWVTTTQAALREILPRFERYQSLDYQDPANIVMKTLRTVYESKIFETDENGASQPIASLRDLKSDIETELNRKVSELLSYVQRYNQSIRRLEFNPTIDFSGGLKSGQFSIDDGRGFHWLTKCGNGTKRRLLMAFFDWEKDILGKQQTRPLLRGYDEPDVNLHYEAQRHMYRTIRDTVYQENSRIQAIVCTHSLTMIDHAPAISINLLRLCECGMTGVNYLDTLEDQDVEDFLANLAAELGITNSILFYEHCYIIIEGSTEENALPIFYHRLYGHSMIEDGIRLINIEGNGGKKGLLKLLGKNRQQLTIAFLDSDTKTNKDFDETGFARDRNNDYLIYIGQKEFEDSFSDETICSCLNEVWPRIDNETWTSAHLSGIRSESNKKFSDGLMGLIYLNSESDISNTKPVYGQKLASICPLDLIPERVIHLFNRARDIARVG
jgi:putative ATP-dependent endonuclease of OLD family